MSLPSKFLYVVARPSASNRAFPASTFATPISSSSSLRRLILLHSPSGHRHPSSASSRLYSTPYSAPIDSVNLLDKAPDLCETFALPPPPSPPPSPPLRADDVAASLADLGLGGYWPTGLVQHGLDALHSLGLPWWGCIVTGAVLVRTCMVPLFGAVQRNTTNMLNHAPEVQQFQMRFFAAKQVGDRTGVLRIYKEQRQYYRDNDISQLRQLKLMMAQMSVFCSMFFGLKAMALLPIETFKTEGLLHIVDLTTSDPYLILPTLTSATLGLTLWLGAEGIKTDDFPPLLKKFFMLFPVFAFFPVAYFPSAMGLYWVTSNLFSLLQFLLFRSAWGKRVFRIPERREMPQGYGAGLGGAAFAEQFGKMMEVAQEAALTQAKVQSMTMPDDRRQWEGLKTETDGEKAASKSPLSMPLGLSPEEVASRHKDIKKMIKEINEMKKKVEALNPGKEQKTNKPPDIHIKVPKE